MKLSTILRTSAAAAACAFVLAACGKPKETELVLSDKAANFEAAGDALSKRIQVNSNEAWTVTSSENWASVTPAAGEGEGSFTITVTENSTFETRNATVTVTAKEKTAEVKVTQLSPSPSLAIDPQIVSEFGYAGGTCEITVTSNAPWTVSTDSEWITYDAASGSGNGKIVLNVAPNAARANRSGKVSVKESIAGTERIIDIAQEMAPLSRFTDSLALMEIYKAADGANWKEGRVWDPATPIDTWYGVSVREGRVTGLKIGTKTITAATWEIPAAIADLELLDTLTMGSNMVKGEFPEALYELKHLMTLDLSTNELTGGFSSKMGNWTEMRYITLLNNKGFAGTLPDAIGNLKKLFRVNLSGTSIGGAIPAALAGCTNLQEFMAFNAKFTGELPDIWDKFKNDFKILMLYGNEGLTGELPASLGNIVSSAATISYHLYNCNFTGNIPESFANLPSGAKQIRVQGNKLSGTVPAAVKSHPNWTTWKAETYIFPQQEGYGLN